MRRTPQALGVVGPRTASKGEWCKFAPFFYLGRSGRAVAGERENSDSRRRVLSEDSPAVPAGRLAVEQGRITVSDASRVMDEPAEVQPRALERVIRGGPRNLTGTARRVNDDLPRARAGAVRLASVAKRGRI